MRSIEQAGIISLLLLLLICNRSLAQPHKLRFERININHGLSHNDVFRIMQDSKGYLWFGTADGLNKYDGYRFTTYHSKPYDTASLTQNVVTGVWGDAVGMIWVHPVNSYLNRFNPVTETFSVINLLPNKNVQFDPRLLQEIIEDNEGMMWVSNQFGQLCRFDKRTHCIVGKDYGAVVLNNPYNKANSDKSIRTIFKDKNGTLWIGNSEGLHQVHLIPSENRQPAHVRFTHYWYNPKDSNSILPVWRSFVDRTGKFWLGSQQGLVCFDPQTKQITRYTHEEKNPNSISDNRISTNGIAEDAQGNLWIATAKGLNKLNKDRTTFTRFYHDPKDPTSLSGDIIFTLLIDKSNTLWIGTLHNGISKVNLNYHSFPLYRHNPFDRNSLSHNHVTAICEDQEGFVWIGTRGGGLNAWNRITGIFKHYRHDSAISTSLFSNLVGAVFEDRAGNLWVGGGKNKLIVLSLLNKTTGQFKHHLLESPSISNPWAGPILTAYEDKAGLFWLGTVNGIVTFDPKTGQSHHYPFDSKNPHGLSDHWIVAFCEDRQGNMWIGTSTERLNKLDRKTWKFTHYAHHRKDSGSIGSSTVRSIYEDSKGILWFGTIGGGLSRLNPDHETFTTFTTKHGLPSNTIHSIQEDNEGNLWLGTGKGLSRSSLSNLTFTNYDDKDGLQSNQFTVGHVTTGTSFKGRDGMLYFGGVNGFNAFDPKDLQQNQYVPPVVINQFTLFDQAVPGKQNEKKIELRHDQNFFSFEFAALDYTNSQKNQYAYQLEGVDKDWVYSGTRRLASYTDIAPGSYVFRVKGSNNDGVWNEKGTSIKIIIHPPWYRTWWFYSLCTLSVTAIIYVLFQYQLQQKLRVLQIRNRLHRDLHDDVGATLSSVKLYSEILKDNPNQPMIAELIKDNSAEMIERLEVIAWATDPQQDSFHSLKSRMFKFAVPLCHSKNIRFQLESSGIEEDYLIVPGEIRQNIFLILKEAMNNTIKYAEATDCTVSMLLQGHQFTMQVSDNGKGCDGSIKGNGNGHKNMMKRAEELNGHLSVKGSEGNGTTVLLQVPYPFKIRSSWDKKSVAL